MDQKKLLLIAAACGGVVFVGVLMPWATVSGSLRGFATGNMSGTSDGFDLGIVVLLLGLVGGAFAALVGTGKTDVIKILPKQQILIAGACFAVAALLTFINFFKDHFKTVDTPMGSMGISRGMGLYLTLLAAIGGAVCVGMVLKQMGVIGGGGGGSAEPTDDA